MFVTLMREEINWIYSNWQACYFLSSQKKTNEELNKVTWGSPTFNLEAASPRLGGGRVEVRWDPQILSSLTVSEEEKTPCTWASTAIMKLMS